MHTSLTALRIAMTLSRHLGLWFAMIGCIIAGVGTAVAQEEVDEALIAKIKKTYLRGQFGGGFLVGNPQGAYRDSLRSLGAPNVGYGFAFTGGYIFHPIPVGFTIDGGVLFMGGDTKERIEPSGFFRDTIQVSTQTSVIPLSVSFRVQPDVETWLYPYAEVIGGVNLYMSRYSVSRSNLGEVASDSRSDAGWTYGLGAGMAVKLADMITLPDELQRITIDLRFRYIVGGQTQVSTVTATDQTYEFKTANVETTDIVTALIGFTFQF